MRDINRIIVHCTATPEGRDVSVGEVRTWHLARNFSDVGYHYLITLNGTVEVGRPESKVGAHVRGHNKDSIGIAYAGGMDKSYKNPKDTRTHAQKEALIWLIDELKKDIRVAPFTVIMNILQRLAQVLMYLKKDTKYSKNSSVYGNLSSPFKFTIYFFILRHQISIII